jgi:hypothetical protein
MAYACPRATPHDFREAECRDIAYGLQPHRTRGVTLPATEADSIKHPGEFGSARFETSCADNENVIQSRD